MKPERIVKTFFNTWIDLEVVIGITDVKFNIGYGQEDYVEFTIICSTPPAHGTSSECNIIHKEILKHGDRGYSNGGFTYVMTDTSEVAKFELNGTTQPRLMAVHRLQLKVDELVKQWKAYKS
jgi:hypothetical protein